MYQLFSNEQFTSGFTVRQENGIDIITIGAKAKGDAAKLELKLVWETENIGVNLTWSPNGYRNKTVRPDWGGSSNSSAMSGAPVFCNVAYDDTNRMTIACADAKNSVRISSGVVEETARLKNSVIINVDCAIDTYSTEVLVDTRAIPFYKCVDNVAAWWEEHDGYKPMEVPDDARRPLYSAWYSFHQQVDVPRIVDECRYFAELGCKVLIVDDGWQTSDNSRGYAYCGDWQPAPEKVPDMKAFVDAVHSTGLKFMLWYSVPFVGIHSAAYKRFSDKTLYMNNGLNAAVLDPRYPDVREYLIDVYRRAARDWGLDGFKLDFIDSFRQSAQVRDGMDYVSVYDAVDRLMKDVMYELKKLKSDILIEFRQSYMGPLMRTFGNMIRSGDCPCDSNTNKLNILALRMTGRGTATHSDMVMWNYSEPVELAAFQLTNVLFSVPQISVLHDRMPEDHAKMVKNYLGFFTKYRDILLDGEMMYKNYAADFTYVSSRLGNTQVGAVYSGRFAYLDEPTDNIVIVNASLEQEVLLDAKFDGVYEYKIYDCMGNEVNNGYTVLDNTTDIYVPTNGRIEMMLDYTRTHNIYSDDRLLSYHERLCDFYAGICESKAEKLRESIVNMTIRALQKFDRESNTMLSSPDSGLKNLWDEVCVQCQNEQSHFWDMYEELILDTICKIGEDKLSENEKKILWCCTDNYIEWSECEFDEVSELVEKFDDKNTPSEYNPYDVWDMILEDVLAKAGDYTNDRIRRYIDSTYLD